MWISRRLSVTRFVRSATTARSTALTADTCAVLTAIDEQSADIALGVDNSLERKL